MAGRSTPGKTPSTYIPMAMAAPVFPADTSASHSPDLQSSAATRSDESRLRRRACEAGSAIPTTWEACRTETGSSCALSRMISRSTAALSPTSTEASPNSRAAATAPSTTTAGPKSPPMASTAIFIGRGSLASKLLALDRDDFPALVVAALQADLVGQLHFPALRTDGPRGHGHLVVGAALAPAGLGMSSFRQRHWVVAPWRRAGRAGRARYRCSRSASVLRAAQRGSLVTGAHAQVTAFRLAPQDGHRPLQSSRQSGFMGSPRAASVSSRASRSIWSWS